MNKIVCVLAVLLLASACATSRIGFTRDQLVDRLGVPDRTVKIDDSTEAWAYKGDATYTLKDGVVTKRTVHWGVSVTVNEDRR